MYIDILSYGNYTKIYVDSVDRPRVQLLCRIVSRSFRIFYLNLPFYFLKSFKKFYFVLCLICQMSYMSNVSFIKCLICHMSHLSKCLILSVKCRICQLFYLSNASSIKMSHMSYVANGCIFFENGCVFSLKWLHFCFKKVLF